MFTQTGSSGIIVLVVFVTAAVGSALLLTKWRVSRGTRPIRTGVCAMILAGGLWIAYQIEREGFSVNGFLNEIMPAFWIGLVVGMIALTIHTTVRWYNAVKHAEW